MKLLLILAIALTAITVLAFAAVPLMTANAQTTVTFAVSAEDVDFLTSGDRLVFTGAPATTSPGGSCTAQSNNPVQQVIVVTPHSPGRTGEERSADIIILSSPTPLRPGTQLDLDTLAPAGSNCTIDNIEYARFTATVIE